MPSSRPIASENAAAAPTPWTAYGQHRDLLAAFIAGAPIAISMFDRDMRIIQVSERWLKDFHIPRDAAIGRTVYELFPDSERRREIHRRCIAGGMERLDEQPFVHVDGTMSWVRWEIHPWGIAGTADSGVVVFCENVTEQKQAELAAVANENRLHLAQAAAQIGTWEWNPVSNVNSLSPELHRMFDTDINDANRVEQWASRVHPDDLARVRQLMTEGGTTGSMEFEYRYHHPTLGLRWFYCKGRKFSERDDRIFGIVLDITDRRQHEEALRRNNDDLEMRVQARTYELAGAVEELRRSEERFRLLVEGVQDYAIFMLDPAGYILSWNSGVERIKGYLAKDVIGKHFSMFYPAADIAANKPARELEIAVAEGRYEEEGWRVRKDGSMFWANVLITAIYDSSTLCGFSKVTRDISERLRAETAVRQLSARLLQSQDEERRRLARELHDSTGQVLSALSLNLSAVKQHINHRNTIQADAILDESMKLVDQACSEIRTLSYLLHPPLLDEAGLAHALQWYVDGFTKRTAIVATLTIAPTFEHISREQEMTLFRIVQESLTNIHRHSESVTADIRLLADASNTTLEIRDYGKGIPEEIFKKMYDGPSALGVGLRGMWERVRQLGGHMDVKQVKPGTLVRVMLPLAVSTPPSE